MSDRVERLNEAVSAKPFSTHPGYSAITGRVPELAGSGMAASELEQ